MFHVSFRYIFGIPPLILVLLPGASSDCDIDGKSDKVFGNILMVSFNALVKERKPPTLHKVQPTKTLEEKKLLKEQKKQDDSPCFVKRLLDEIKTCWNKILRGAKKH
uniref:Interleukin-7 n=1 Tax=Tupaia chinensis TaxID=246437 RepID=L7NU76_TUPCH|nr:interleukin-7 variant 5 [Tupaia chinensis]